MLEYEADVLDVIERAPGVKSFRLLRKDEVDFKPGQWFLVFQEISGEEAKKPFSFSSSPTEADHIEFTKRITDSDFSKALDNIKKGDKLKVKLPYGNFTFEGEEKKIGLLSAGIGITPFRSICKNATDKKLSTNIVMLYGSRDPNNIVFKEDFDSMQEENPNLKVINTLTCPNPRELGWEGCCGYIDKAMIEREVPDYKERVFFVCGPPDMVSCLVEELKKDLEMTEEHVRIEHFVGY